MKKGLFILLSITFWLNAIAQEELIAPEKQSKEDIVKKGISLGPLPVIAFDADKGLQYGALLNIYDFGDGSHYPQPRQQWYIETSWYTKGTQQYFLTYDTRHLIPDVRMSVASTVVFDKAMDFYGYNGFQANYYPELQSPFYRLQRFAFSAKADFVGNIWNKKLFWQAGYYFSSYKYQNIDLASINKGKPESEKFTGQTLYEKYIDWGIISQDEKKGGLTSAIRAGLMYDTRDFEASPARGIWAEANITMAPKFLGSTNSYYRYMLIFRQYLPLVPDHLTFAYRLDYQGSIGNYLPYYIMPVFSNIGKEYDRDGIGGYRTVRGIMRDRVQGLDVGFLNAEFRWKFMRFHLLKQNIYLGLNAFLDGAVVTRNYDLSYRGTGDENSDMFKEYKKYIDTTKSDGFHFASGGGFRIGINQNFIIAVDYAVPFNKQDGKKGSLYINTGFLF
ncbi:MAG: BamA/TamA family outer membrane protein [Paludibacter sp.]|nr:BamA/TamA family outer membrane protein [Paludibacter sp.]